MKSATAAGQSVVFLGTTDEVSTCDCCGRSELKSTVALSIDGGDAVYYGVVCAARTLGRSAKEVRAGAKKADDDKAAREAAVKRAADIARDARWQAFLDARVPQHSGKRLEQVLAIGQAGRDEFRAAERAAGLL